MKVIMIETNKWSVEVKAKTKKQAIEKAQKMHTKNNLTFEHYLDEGNRLDFECGNIKSNLYQG
jgi:uncharacterized protein YbcV (DUF1398 family)|tara:strand:+ start:419 stop:607 length:189 start_codon:yes stop_codon:yes gene_type:complete